jgi:diguanylate cyclase (GGDEF)-like protein
MNVERVRDAAAAQEIAPSASLAIGESDAVAGRLHEAARELARIGAQLPESAGTAVESLVHRCLQAMREVDDAYRQEMSLRKSLEQDLRRVQGALTEMSKKLAETLTDVSRARHQASHDELTSLPNRRHFQSMLRSVLSDQQISRPPLALMYLDLDQFKWINDSHGHDTGDELLKIVGARLVRGLRAEDMVCRMGGDEFACLLMGPVNRRQLRLIATNLYELVSAPARVGQQEFKVTPSIGIAVHPDDGSAVNELLKSADVAMYSAKRWRSRYAFAARIRSQSRRLEK